MGVELDRPRLYDQNRLEYADLAVGPQQIGHGRIVASCGGAIEAAPVPARAWRAPNGSRRGAQAVADRLPPRTPAGDHRHARFGGRALARRRPAPGRPWRSASAGAVSAEPQARLTR